MNIFNKIDKTNISEKHHAMIKEFAIKHEKIFEKCDDKIEFNPNNLTPFIEHVLLQCMHSENDAKYISNFYKDMILFFMENNTNDSDEDIDDFEKDIDNEINNDLLNLEHKLIDFLPNFNKMRNNNVCEKWIDSDDDFMLAEFCKNCSFFRSMHLVCNKFIDAEFGCGACGLDIYDHIICDDFTPEKINDTNYLNRKNDICLSCGLQRNKHFNKYRQLGKNHCKTFETNEYGSCKNCIFDFQSHLAKTTKSSLEKLKEKVKKVGANNDLVKLENIEQEIKETLDKKLANIKNPPKFINN